MVTVLGWTARRRLAARLLWVWLFALSAGIANACALGFADLPAAAPHEHGAMAHGHGDEAAPASAPPSPQPASACQKFCDDKGLALSLAAKDSGSPDNLPSLLLAFTLPAWTSGEARALDEPTRHLPAHETGPPIPIRFLRLVI